MPVMLLTELPPDILIDGIASRLPIHDIFSLLQTCQCLHTTITTSRFLWDSLSKSICLPLDLLAGTDFHDPHIIRETVRNALHVEHVFRKVERYPTLVKSIPVDFVSSQLEMLTDVNWNWLLALTRKNVEVSSLSCWCITPDTKHQLVSLDIPGAVAFSAALSASNQSVTVAVIAQTSEHESLLKVFQISISTGVDPMICTGSTLVLADVSQDASEGTFFRVELWNNIVAVGTAFQNSLHLLLIDLKENTAQRLTFPDVEYPAFKISSRQIVTFTGSGNTSSGMGMDAFDFADDVHPKKNGVAETMCIRSNSCLPTRALNESAWHLHMDRLHTASQISLTGEDNLKSGVQTLAFLAEFSVYRPYLYGRIQVHPVIPSLPTEFHSVHLTGPETAIELLSMGKSGRRAVWLERSLETNEYRLMKITFDWSTGPVSACPLLPTGMVLPFELETCRALFLHEARGILLLGLYTGLVYIIDL